MKIDSTSIRQLTHALHLQFACETKSKIERFNPLTPWVAELHARNDAFDRLVKACIEQRTTKPSVRMKDTRNETDEVYKNIVLVINPLIVMEGETVYAPFVTEQNELIKHYSDLIAQHFGRNKAKKISETE
jgi:hypothetical protein